MESPSAPYVGPAPLAETAAGLRSGALDLAVYLDDLCDRIDAIDPHVQALLPEPGRRSTPTPGGSSAGALS